MASDPSDRTWLQRSLSRIARTLDPDAVRDREDVRDVMGLIREWRARQEEDAAGHGKRLDRVKASIEGLTRESAGNKRDLLRVRHLMSKQRDRLSHLLRVAALDRRGIDAESKAVERLTRLARSPLPVVVGPWTGEVGFELLYWIPFLQWVRATFPIDPDRLIVLSRGGVGDWYGHVTKHYEDIFRYATPADFQASTEERKKQRRVRPFDRQVVKQVMRARGFRRVHLLHPTHMYALFNAYWRYDATVKRLEAFSRFQRLPPVTAATDVPGLAGLPAEFVAVRFYFSSCFPDTPENRAFATRTIEGLATRTHVVLLNNDIVVDDHRDFSPAASARVQTLSAQMRPETNLAVQTAVISRAKAFVGTYGGYSYLAPLYGVNSVAFYSRQTFKQHHLELAHRAFQKIGRARLMPVDVDHAAPLGEALAGTVSAEVLP